MMFALTMDGSTQDTRQAGSRTTRTPLAALAWSSRVVASVFTSVVMMLSLAPGALAQDRDQVFRIHPRTQKVTTLVGVVTENTLENVRIERDGKDNKYSSDEIVRIVWGDVPPSFKDAKVYAERLDFENAVAKFRVTATEAGARPVVQAAARLASAENLLLWGATDATHFADCVTEVDRFLADHTDDRSVPRARWVKARALLLSGDAAGAAAGFQALYEKGANDPPTVGYRREDCLNAGLDAAKSFLAADDVASARALFGTLETAFAGLAAAAEESGAMVAEAALRGAQGEAAVGEGFCILKGGDAAAARTFFEGRLANPGASSAERYAAMLGIAESYRRQNKNRNAQIEFAKVSALDHTDRDRAARALVGLADATLQLADSDAKGSARTWLTQVTEVYGDTPSAAVAAEMLTGL
ncbi:MAG: hypothetical protein GY711_22175 [bacterium]|nr:hypothetical protein [bacterium]